MSNSNDYYQILGVSPNASFEEIKRAYRKLSLTHHPDKTNNNEEMTNKFKKINEAYEIIGDEIKRREYDMSRTFGGGGVGGFSPMDDDIFNILNMFSKINMQHFGPNTHGHENIRVFHNGVPMNINAMGVGGGMGGLNNLTKPIPIVKNINITIEQVLLGANVPIEIERFITENGNKTFEKETIYIKIYKGIDDGEVIILRERGNIINDKIKGDVKVVVRIVNDTQFERKGLDLIYKKTITLKEALVGFSFELKYFNKIYNINSHSGNIISPGYVKVIEGMGLQRDEYKGNLLIVFDITFPEKLDNEAIEKIKEINL